MNQIADIHQTQPRAPGDGRGDLAEIEIELRGGDGGVIALDGRLILGHQGLLGIELLA
jgi:hypothetical protein